MRILLSNDDGINAPGLVALCEAVSDLGEIDIVAPDTQQSAASHSITLSAPLAVREVDFQCGAARRALSVDGRPADCVRLAIRKLLDTPPDLVLSGINDGVNVGVNVFYSGTVAAAAEAAMLGIPAVAFSAAIGTGDLDYFARVGKVCRKVLEQLLAVGLASGDLINVNVPDLSAQSGEIPRGVCVVAQSTAELEDVYHLQQSGADVEVYRLGDEYTFAPGQQNTDAARLAEGYITITPLHVDMTNHDRLAALLRNDWTIPFK